VSRNLPSVSSIREKAELSQERFATLLIGTHLTGLGAGPPSAIGRRAHAAFDRRAKSESIARRRMISNRQVQDPIGLLFPSRLRLSKALVSQFQQF